MRKVEKVLVVFLFIAVVFIGKNVYAEEVYYTNRSGVEFTREQYDFYTYLTHDGYQEYVTQDMLDEVNWDDLESMDVRVVRYCPMQTGNMGNVSSPQDNNLFVSTQYKGVSIGKYCTPTYCRVMTQAEWYDEPNIKSYDLIGSYLDGPTRLTTPTTIISSTTSSSYEETIVYDTDGFGAVVKVPDTGDDINITQTFLYSGTGTIFSSYQHAMSTISLSDAQLFHIGLIGYGNVFDFYGASIGKYDQMPGVSIDV